MKSFKEFNIKPKLTAFVGDKIKMERILNVPIEVHDYKLGASSAIAGTEVLTLQIKKSNLMHVVFTGSKVLIQQIEEVPKGAFPFITTIVKNNEYFEFT